MNPVVGLKKQAPARDRFVEVGSTGLKHWAGILDEEFLRELRGANGVKVYREMSKNDAVVGASLFAYTMLAREVTFRVDSAVPGDAKADEVREFIEGALLKDMSLSWRDLLGEIFSFLAYGWAWFEVVYKRRSGDVRDPTARSRFADNRIGWRKWAIRGQDTLWRWEIDEHGGTNAMVQRAAPLYHEMPLPVERALLFRTILERGGPEGVSILRTAYTCFSDDTELLTRRGFVNVSDVTMDDDVATLNPAGQLEYQRPEHVWAYRFTGHLLEVAGRSTNQLVTPDHRLWARRDHDAEYRFIEARSIRRSARQKSFADWPAPDVTEFSLPEYHYGARMLCGERTMPTKNFVMDDWLRFLGAWFAEGSCGRDTKRNKQVHITITQKLGAKCDVMQEWMCRLGWRVHKYTKDDRDIATLRISSVQLWNHLKEFGHAKTKSVPAYVKHCSARQIRLFLDAFHLGDGTIAGGGTVRHGDMTYGPYKGTKLYYTASPRLADDLCELILKAGNVPRLRVNRGQRFGGPIFVVTEAQRQEYMVRRVALQPYRGYVYCVTTENGVVYARRRGRCQWSGNSWYYKRRIRVVQGIGIERDLAGMPMLTPPEGLDIWNPNDATAIAKKAEAEKIVRNIRRDEHEGVLVPHGWELKLLASGGSRQFDTTAVIGQLNSEIAMSMMTDFLLVGHEKIGARSMREDARDTFSHAAAGFLDSICDVINRFAIPELVRLNGWDEALAPRLAHGPVAEIGLSELTNFIEKTAAVGLLFPDVDLEKYLRQRAQLPPAMEAPKPSKSEEEPATAKTRYREALDTLNERIAQLERAPRDVVQKLAPPDVHAHVDVRPAVTVNMPEQRPAHVEAHSHIAAPHVEVHPSPAPRVDVRVEPPQVRVEPPAITVESPTVNVAPASVNVHPVLNPTIQVEAPPAPNVTVTTPAVRVEPPDVHVHPTQVVHVPPAKVDVHVAPPAEKKARSRRIERDERGRPLRVVDEE